MKKLFVVFVMLGGLLVTSGCQRNTSPSSENNQNVQSVESTEGSVDQKQLTATIVLTNQGEEVTSKEVTFQENESLLKVMKENFTIEEKDGFITSIDGMSQDQKNNVFWVYTVNDEMSDKAAQDLLLKKDDTITFNLQAF
ncbi:DUF4430 domain-containing protein [Enterococcus sp.]|jgi:hypothetical protein|uniref:DUF4430 domain-containing protein n=1 Tax=Enterococcus sp. TaxID=35783 RepID=UPI0025C1436D|nr:DUF4430 domain-containing protein [Enterococcus sp.]